jgi:hypothetical protein
VFLGCHSSLHSLFICLFRCKALSEIAEGICARVYFFKCSAPQKKDCLVNSEFLKLRQKLDKSFPEFNDIVKVVLCC